MASYCPTCGNVTRLSCGKCHFHASKSQKVQGYRATAMHGQENNPELFGVLSVACKCSEDPSEIDHLTLRLPCFARPCPVRPRHGFVESRVVKTREEIVALIQETRAADPEGEIMFMRYIDAKASGIWMPNMLTVGKGHDGATAGKGAECIPLVGVYDKNSPVFTYAKLAPDEVPYVEFVIQGASGLYATQVRSGPPVVGVNPTFIPSQVVVKRVITFDPALSLLEWERLMDEAKGEDGVVVYHPNTSITDHGSVHARSRNIPVVIHPVEIGDTLDPIPIEPPDPEAVLHGLAIGEAIELTPENWALAVDTILVGLHHSAAMSGAYGKWIGIAVAIMLRLGSIALRGEARHERSQGNRNLQRQTVYRKHLKRSLRYHRSGIVRLLNLFRYGDFGKGHACGTGGTGGMFWAACAAALIPLFNGVRELGRKRDDESVRALVGALNRAVNQAHNNGWWLNKFTQSHGNHFVEIAHGAHSSVLGIAPFVTQVMNVKGKEGRVDSYGMWPETVITTPKPVGSSVVVIPNGLAVSLKVRSQKSPVILPIPLNKFTTMIAANLGIKHDGGRYRVVIDAPSEKAGAEGPTIVWEEPTLRDDAGLYNSITPVAWTTHPSYMGKTKEKYVKKVSNAVLFDSVSSMSGIQTLMKEPTK